MPDPTAEGVVAAGIIRTPGVDDVIEGVEKAIDAVEYQQKYFEGEELSAQEQAWARQLLGRIAHECNVRLNGRIKIVGAHPELMGFGARLYGLDSDNRQYTIDFRYDDEDRMGNERMDDERRVRESIDIIVTELLRQRAVYLHRMTGSVGSA